jgi:hypothetical protein
MTPSQPPVTRTTHTLPFDRLSPRDFERLCLGLVEVSLPFLPSALPLPSDHGKIPL